MVQGEEGLGTRLIITLNQHCDNPCVNWPMHELADCKEHANALYYAMHTLSTQIANIASSLCSLNTLSSHTIYVIYYGQLLQVLKKIHTLVHTSTFRRELRLSAEHSQTWPLSLSTAGGCVNAPPMHATTPLPPPRGFTWTEVMTVYPIRPLSYAGMYRPRVFGL